MTASRVVTSRAADADAHEAVDYYATNAPQEVAVGWVDALEDAKNLLAQYPSIGSARYEAQTGVEGLRGYTLQRYPYVLIYTDDQDAIRIHRILHTSRDVPSELSTLL